MPDMQLLEEILLHRVPLWVWETGWLVNALFCCQAWLSSLFPTCRPWQGAQGSCRQSVLVGGRSVKGCKTLAGQAGLPRPLPHMGLRKDLHTDSAAGSRSSNSTLVRQAVCQAQLAGTLKASSQCF